MNFEQPKVYICVLNWNGWKDTIECLQSIYNGTYCNYIVVVIDNGSEDESVENIKNWFKGRSGAASKEDNKNKVLVEYDRSTAERGGNDVTEEKLAQYPNKSSLIIIQSGSNLGFAGGNNIAIKYAIKNNADYIWLLNNDSIIDKTALIEVMKFAISNKKLGMIGSKLLVYDNPSVMEGAGGGKNIHTFLIGIGGGYRNADQEPDHNSEDLEYIFGASMLVSVESIQDVGLMDEDYFFFSEEIDWNIRVKKNGWKLGYCPGSIVYHKGSKSIQRTSPARDYYFIRNNLFLVRKFYPYWVPLAISRAMIRISKRIRTKQWKNAKAILIALIHFIVNKKGMYTIK